MFNGIIFNQGLITKFEKRSKGINIFVKADLKLTGKDLGVSVACDGVCLTLIDIKNKIIDKNAQILFIEKKIAYENMNFDAACRTFNILLSEQRKVVLILM